MEDLDHWGSSLNGIQYEAGRGTVNTSFIDMALGEGGSAAVSVFLSVGTNNSLNTTGQSGDGQSLPMYIMVWVMTSNILVFLAGVLGNLLVILVVTCVREMKTSTNLCLMNLSVADLLVLLICQPSAMLEFIGHEKWLLGDAMCKLTTYLENLVTVASILIILTVSVERFWAVYYPLKTHTTGSKSKAVISMIVVWLTSAAVTSPFLVMSYTDQQYHTIDKQMVDVCITPTPYLWHKWYIVGRFVLIFAIPLILLAILYAMIIYKITTETMDCKQMTETAKNQSQQNRRQLVGMLVGIILLFFICLLPFRILAFWLIFAAPEKIVETLGLDLYLNLLYFCRLLIYVNSAGNPIIYNVVSTKFRRAFQKVLRMYCCGCKKKMIVGRGVSNGTFSHATRMTTMSHYSTVEQDANDVSDTVDAV